MSPKYAQLKDTILNEIKTRSLLSDYTSFNHHNISKRKIEIEDESKKLRNLIKEFARNRGAEKLDEEKYVKHILCDRTLLENELFTLTAFLLRNSNKIVIRIDNLSKKIQSPEFIDILQLLLKQQNKELHYKYSADIKRDLEYIRRSLPGFDTKCIHQSNNIDNDLTLLFDNRINIFSTIYKTRIYENIYISHSIYNLRINKS